MPTHIKSLINKVVKELRNDNKSKEKILSVIENLIDKKIQKHIKSYRLYKKNLIFYVDSSIWIFEVNLFKKKVLDELKKENLGVKNIKIKINKS